MVLSGISTPFEMLSQTIGQIIHALLTRAPLDQGASPSIPFDLHVLSAPPAFVLSQDQTLQFYTGLFDTQNNLLGTHCSSTIQFSKSK